jgi:SAM-dependent methyltransferase
MPDLPAFSFACPRCCGPLELTAQDEMRCPADGLRFLRRAGVWRMLLPEREPLFARFSRDYETIRRAEGRGSQDPAYYRALPYQDLSGRMPGDWRIRAASFDALLKQVVLPEAARRGRPLRLLDLGAGNGWLSNRLARLGHAAAAVDVLANDFDGLGCAGYYESTFTPVQAEFDHLPFADRMIDLVIFNASLHYSPDYVASLAQARRVLEQEGKIVVMDTPVYHNGESGAAMVRERQAQFVRQYGTPSDALPSQNYLTYAHLDALAAALDLRCQLVTPAYPLGWQIRPYTARLLGRREPARFHLIIFKE